MNPLQRFKIAAKRGIPDQVPVLPFATGHYIAWFAGLKQREYWWDPVKKFDAQLKLHERFPGVMFYPGIWPDYSVAVETSALGCEISWPEDASPQVCKHVDIDSVVEPANPEKDGLMPKVLETYRYMQNNLPSQYIKEYEYLDGWATSLGPIDVAGISVGYDVLFEKFYTDPEKVHQLMQVITETIIRYVKAQEKIGGKLKRYMIADDGIGLISPQQFKEFALPYLKIIFSNFSYAIGIFHCDSNTSHLLEGIPEIGMDVFNFGPQVKIEEIKSKIGNKVCLFGNLPPISIAGIAESDTLQKGTVQDVDRACKRLIEVGKPGGGYMLTTGSGMAAGTPAENIQAMLKAAEKYGKY